MKERKWQRPELLILVRSYSEENILTVCRANATPLGQGGAQSGDGHGCQATRVGSCQACQSLGGGIS